MTAGAFQSDALLVPEHCLFDHIHNQTKCWDFDQWNRTASTACQERGMKVKSFAMLLPCGIDVFSGVEFVCCPFSKNAKKGAGLLLKACFLLALSFCFYSAFISGDFDIRFFDQNRTNFSKTFDFIKTKYVNSFNLIFC